VSRPLAGPGLLAIVAGAVAGTGLFLFVAAVRGLPPRPSGETGRLRRWAHETGPSRAAAAVLAGPGGAGGDPLAGGWRGSGPAGAELARPVRCGRERAAMARLEALATWTSRCVTRSRGAVAWSRPSLPRCAPRRPRCAIHWRALVERLHTRVPMPEALRRFADDLADPSADLIIAALMINARLRGPGLRTCSARCPVRSGKSLTCAAR